jgi:hypothetical protein
MKYFAKLLVGYVASLLKHFLPEDRLIQHRMRAYLAAATLLSASLIMILNLFGLLVTTINPSIHIEAVVLLVFTLLSLFALKRGVKQERVTGFFLFVLTTMISVMLGFHSHSFYAPGIFFFLIAIMHASLLSSNRWAVAQSIYAVCATIFLFWKNSDYGMNLPFNWTFDTYVMRLRVVIVLVCFACYLCMILHDYFSRRSEVELHQEKDWLLRSSRLHEVSTLAESLSFQVTGPLRELSRDFQRLKDAHGSEGFATLEHERVASMSRSVEELIQISRSFDWIYRSHKLDNLISSPISNLLKQLKILLEGKALENAWTLKFDSDISDEELKGGVPSLMLLLVTLAHRNFERYSSAQDMALTIRVEALDKNSVVWRMIWPQTPEKMRNFRFDSPRADLSHTVDEIREALILELAKDCGASLESFDRGNESEIKLVMARLA